MMACIYNRARLPSVRFPLEIVERFTPEWFSAERVVGNARQI